MGFLKIKVDVENPDEVITNHKGQLIGLASMLMKREKKKHLVQKKIYERIIAELEIELKEKLKEEGVRAEISLTIESDDSGEVEMETIEIEE